MIHPTQNYWVPSLSPKQLEVFNNMKIYQLVSGPVMSGKSIAVEHRLIRHCWDNPGARVAAFAKTVKSAKHGGSWEDLLSIVIPEWEAAGLTGVTPDIKFGYTQPPKVDGATRTHLFRLRNRFGGESEFMLFSLDVDSEVQSKLKNTRFSAFWFIELTNFGDEVNDQGKNQFDIWRVSSNRLRMVHLPPENHLWIADTNPAETGVEHWAYKLFYEKQPFILPDDEWMYNQISVVEIQIADNPWLSPIQIAKIKAENRSDPAQYQRNVQGLWVAANKGGHFGDLFLPTTHIRGDVSKPIRSECEVIIPPAGTFELYGGFDPGDLNHAAVICCKRSMEDTYCYDVIDEVISLGTKVSIADFVEEFISRMDYWEALLLELYNVKSVKWRFWSDSSAMDFNSGIGGAEDKLIYAESLGRIELRGVPKPKGSVRDRVKAVRRLLHENRLFVSAQLTETIAMFRNLKRGTSTAEYVANDKHKHAFDALGYLIAGEEPAEMFSKMQQYGKRRSSGYVSIAA